MLPPWRHLLLMEIISSIKTESIRYNSSIKVFHFIFIVKRCLTCSLPRQVNMEESQGVLHASKVTTTCNKGKPSCRVLYFFLNNANSCLWLLQIVNMLGIKSFTAFHYRTRFLYLSITWKLILSEELVSM